MGEVEERRNNKKKINAAFWLEQRKNDSEHGNQNEVTIQIMKMKTQEKIEIWKASWMIHAAAGKWDKYYREGKQFKNSMHDNNK